MMLAASVGDLLLNGGVAGGCLLLLLRAMQLGARVMDARTELIAEGIRGLLQDSADAARMRAADRLEAVTRRALEREESRAHAKALRAIAAAVTQRHPNSLHRADE